jgi:hypothetical protein
MYADVQVKMIPGAARTVRAGGPRTQVTETSSHGPTDATYQWIYRCCVAAPWPMAVTAPLLSCVLRQMMTPYGATTGTSTATSGVTSSTVADIQPL